MSDTSQFENCTQVTPECPVEATTYGYAPNLAGNIVLLAVFAACNIAQVSLGIWYRVWAFNIVVSFGCLLEWVGYVGRIIMHNNAWSTAGFDLQIVCLIIAPSFLAAGIYLTLKHIVMVLGPQYSRLSPKLYTWIFISCDFAGIVVQAVGGGLAATADSHSLAQTGGNIMVAGIAIQVATMSICVLLAIDFGWRLIRSRKNPGFEVDGHPLEKVKTYTTSTGFYFYMICTSIAFITIYIRCIYRLPEMAGGWGSALQRDETEFLVLDGAMIAIASILMSIAHPGIFFPDIRTKRSKSIETTIVSPEDGRQRSLWKRLFRR